MCAESITAILQVYPFVRQLKAWIKKEKRKANGSSKNRAVKNSQSLKGVSNGGPSADRTSAQGVAKQPTEAKHVEPGQSWIHFKFCHKEILKHLVTT